MLDAAGSIEGARLIARFLFVGAVIVFGLLLLTPWQQNVGGSGRLTAYAPRDRQQMIEAPIDGRVTDWYVGEGDPVAAGDPLVDLSDNDPLILERLGRERPSVQAQNDALTLVIAINEAKTAALEADANTKLEGGRATVQKAKSDQAKAQSELAKIDV